VSRNRYWGTPLPIWVSDDGTERVVIGSVAELKELSGVEDITDLHRDSIDQITITSARTGNVLRRVPEVFDCWFESGSMPYGQKHYPFENKEQFEAGFPADFIAEGLDQTRGWFYTLMVISTALFDKPAFKNLIVNGLVCAADGKKMSKRLKNYPDPAEIVNQYGADALRVYLINSPVVQARKLDFKDQGVFAVVKELLRPWYNSYRFFCEQARRHGFDTNTTFQYDAKKTVAATGVMDRWLLASLQSLIGFVHTEMKAYRLYTVIPRLLEFVVDLSKWYIKLQKDTIKGDHGPEACESTLQVFYEVLLNLCILMAPITPFFVESQYQNLRCALPEDSPLLADSVHFLMFPEPEEAKADEKVQSQVKALQTVIELGRRARDKTVSYRTPLPSVTVCHRDASFLGEIKQFENVIMKQLNVRAVEYTHEFNSLVTFVPEPNRRVLGKKLLKNMKSGYAQILALSQEALLALDAEGKMEMTINGTKYEILSSEVKLTCQFSGDAEQFQPETQGACLLMLAKHATAELKQEGLARELIAKIQSLRKKSNLNSEDVVDVYYAIEEAKAPLLHACVTARQQFILESLRVSSFGPQSTMAADSHVYATSEDTLQNEPFTVWITRHQ
jgi:isoleucyl-tRNA synthetase